MVDLFPARMAQAPREESLKELPIESPRAAGLQES